MVDVNEYLERGECVGKTLKEASKYSFKFDQLNDGG